MNLLLMIGLVVATQLAPGQDPTPPWSRPVPATPSPRSRDLTSRELLKLCGIDQSQLERLYDRRPLDPDEYETLYKILYRLPSFRLSDLDRWTDRQPDWSAVIESPSDRRADIFHIRGRVKRVSKAELAPEPAELLDYQHYYQLTLQLEGQDNPVLLCARQVPPAWPMDQAMDEPTRLDAMFLKVGDVSGPLPQLVLATDRVPWFPDRVDPARSIEPSHVALAKAGLDFALLEELKQQNRMRFSKTEREVFYQWLVASDRMGSMQSDIARRPLELPPLFSTPQQQQGRCFTFQGTVSRVTQVQAPDEIRLRYALDHYYQLDVFLPLGNKVIRVADKDKKEDEQATIHGQYPVVCYAVHLPSELLPPDGGVSDEGTSRPVRITGTFYRLWSYQSEFMTSLADDQWQVAPLVMISTVEVTGKTNPYLGLVGGLSFLVLLGLIWWSQWRYSRTDQSFKRDTLNKRFEVKPNQSLNDLGPDVADKPDFRNLP